MKKEAGQDADGDEEVVSVRDLTRKALEDLVLKYRAKRLKDRKAEDVEKESAKAEEEREKLSKMHSEKKGAPPSVPVEKDDLPEELDQDEDSELE